jgi:hypothetical protein
MPLEYNRATRTFAIGLDLGQRRNFTALAVLEKHFLPFWGDQWVTAGRNEKGVTRYLVRMLERVRRATPYPEVVEWVQNIVQVPDLLNHPKTLVVDGTGVGAPVVDLLRRAKLGCNLIPVTITGTGGVSAPSYTHGYTTVPKSLLLTNLQVVLQEGLIEVAEKTTQGAVLEEELLHLRMNGPLSGRHDDLAFALALAVWHLKPARLS